MSPQNYEKDKFSTPGRGHLCSIPPIYPGWLYASFVAEGKMIKLSHLIGLYKLGNDLQRLKGALTQREQRNVIIAPCIKVNENMKNILSDKVIPLIAVKKWVKKILKDINREITGKTAKLMEPLTREFYWQLIKDIESFEASLSEELSQVPAYIATKKGNFSIKDIVDKASNGYSIKTIGMVDKFIRFEIDEAGRCLAFGMFTACGFHILRSVEVAVKGYIYAAKGLLPPMNRRNWWEYIKQLEHKDIGASSDLIDSLKILRTKRNPLMHPQDNLEEEDAISLFSSCNSTMDELVKDVVNKKLKVKFKDALKKLPTLNLP